MNTNGVVIILIFVFFVTSKNSFAQSTHHYGILPAINVNVNINSKWSYNFKHESRHRIISKSANGLTLTHYDFILSDFSSIVSKKIGLNGRISGGYLLRLEENEIFHRFIQQYAKTQKYSAFRIAHRYVLDQTLRQNEIAEFRSRYRLTLEFPLNGMSVDGNEYYIKLSNEYLLSAQNERANLETRLIPTIGYALNDKHKLELGLDYRFASIFSDVKRNNYWLTLNLFINI